VLDVLHAAKIEEDWYARGLCHDDDVDPELFYPVGTPGNPAYDAQVEEAKGFCEICPVRTACLMWAIESFQEVGVWGGTEENERMAMIRTARQAGALATNRYPTNAEASDLITKLLEAERETQKRIAEKDAETRRKTDRARVLQEQG